MVDCHKEVHALVRRSRPCEAIAPATLQLYSCSIAGAIAAAATFPAKAAEEL